MANANQLQVYAADVMQFRSLAVQTSTWAEIWRQSSLKELAHVAKFLCCLPLFVFHVANLVVTQMIGVSASLMSDHCVCRQAEQT